MFGNAEIGKNYRMLLMLCYYYWSCRTAGVGTCSTCGRLGAIVTPWISAQVIFSLIVVYVKYV